MNRRLFLRFLALSPLAAPAAIVAARAWPAGARGPAGYRFVSNELHEFSFVRVPLARATWIINSDAIRKLEAA